MRVKGKGMPSRIEDYGLLGTTRTAALVARDGSVDWLCAPRFDSPACFAALLGTPEHGRFQIAPAGAPTSSRRAYRPGTMVLESDFETPEGAVRIVDCMPTQGDRCDLVRIVKGLGGRVGMELELVIRFDYGSSVPWVRREGRVLSATAGPEALQLHVPDGVELEPRGFHTVARFDVAEGESLPFTLSWHPSHRPPPFPLDAEAAVHATERWWRSWLDGCTYDGPWREAVLRSLLTLKALTHAPTGGIVAAPTSSLPEHAGGSRNWDYRYCWLRDAAFSLYALLIGGHVEEARSWRAWLERAAAGRPSDLQVLYGLAGERRLPELELPWLPGYQGAKPVRVGNAATGQLQLDVYGELLDAFHVARAAGLEPEGRAWDLERALLDDLERRAEEPDHGIWEVRGPRRHFTHSKVMAWVGFDRAVKAVERFGLEGPVARWRRLRDRLHERVCHEGYHAERGAFVQSFGSDRLDASLLLMPLVGFLPATDPRVRGTADAIARELGADGLLLRYLDDGADGLPAGEGAFLPCSFWLADNLALQGRHDEAAHLFERLLALCNDLGLLAEEYDRDARRMLGNFPQAFSHVMLVNTALNLARAEGSQEHHRACQAVCENLAAGTAAPQSAAPAPSTPPRRVLVLDVGGNHVKMLATGETERRKFSSGPELTAEEMVKRVRELTADWSYDVVSIGFPGPVLHGRPVAEPRNLGPGWVGFDFEAAFDRPVRLVNDAAMQALGSYRGGRMLFLGLGTGLGSALVVDGIVEPMELGHLPYKKGQSFEDAVGERGLERLGKKKWRHEVEAVVERLRAAVQAEYVVLGGGNAAHLHHLPSDTKLGDNSLAFAGGFELWETEDDPATQPGSARSMRAAGS
jgi:GH15 family glucan-1,4-alpha-glucosidase